MVDILYPDLSGNGKGAMDLDARVDPLYRVFYPESYGAKGDGVTNDTAAFVAMAADITAVGTGTVRLRRTTYLIAGPDFQPYRSVPLYTYFNRPPLYQYIMQFIGCKVIIEGNGACIKNAPGGFYGTFNADDTPRIPVGEPDLGGYLGTGAATPYYGMFHFQNCTNVTVRDLELDGNINNTNIGSSFSDTGIQLQMEGMFIEGCNHVQIVNCNIHHHGYDSILNFGPSTGDNDLDDLLHIMDCKLTNSGRNCVSITGGRNIKIENCRIYQAGKNGAVTSNPAAGIDLEAEGGHSVRDVLISNCYMADCSNHALIADSGTDTNRVNVLDCTIIGTTNYSMKPNRRGFRFKRCLIAGTVGQIHPGYGVGADPFEPPSATRFEDCTFTTDTAVSPTGTLHFVNDLIVEGSAFFVEFNACSFYFNRANTGGLGNLDSPIFTDCTFISAGAGNFSIAGRFRGSNTHFIRNDGAAQFQYTPDALIAGTNHGGHAESMWKYSTVVTVIGPPTTHTGTTTVYPATIDNSTGEIFGTRTTASNANIDLYVGVDKRVQRLTGTLTADRTLQLRTEGAKRGSRFRIVRIGGGAFNWNVTGAALLKAMGTANTWADVEFDGTAWNLTGYGAL